MNYAVRDLTELAAMLDQQAKRLGEGADRKRPRSAEAALLQAQGDGFACAANMVRATVLTDPCVVQEYAVACEEARYIAAAAIYASMKANNGDPRWEVVQVGQGGAFSALSQLRRVLT